MVASMLLLAASQWFWLKSEFKDQKTSFYTNSELLFRETVRSIEDSLAGKTIDKMMKDRQRIDSINALMEKPKPIVKRPDRFRISKITFNSDNDTALVNAGKEKGIIMVSGFKMDSLQGNVNLSGRAPEEIRDSLLIVFRALNRNPMRIVEGRPLERLERKEEPPKGKLEFNRWKYRFRSAPLDTLAANFTKKNAEIGIPVSFEIRREVFPVDTSHNFRNQFGGRRRMDIDSVTANGIPIKNMEKITSHSYERGVEFEALPQDLDSYLYSKIRNNVLFSSLLLLFTGVTFVLIYGNLQKQSRLNVMKDDLINNISHELKTPLATISVALEALQQFGAAANPETTKEYLEISSGEAKRLASMVDNILKTSQLEKKGISLTPEPTDLHLQLQELVRSWGPRISSLEGSLSLNVEGEDFVVSADKTYLMSVLNNLVDNAVKYTLGAPTVAIVLKEDKNTVKIVVRDRGVGIPKEYQNMVFDKFFRVPTGDRHNVKGYGLGLSFVKDIMDLHGGTIDLRSDNSGTEFILAFKKA